MKGLRNIGNTCYLNSGLQMIIQNRDLCSLILNNCSLDGVEKRIKSDILKKIGDFILQYYSTEETNPIVPVEIKKIVQERQEIFYGTNQQDSTEFVIYLLDIIDEELKKASHDSKGIEPIFGIGLNVRIKCKLRSCLNIKNIKEKSNFLILDIHSTDESLEDAYHNFKSGDILDSDNLYACENCKNKTVASKRSSIDTWPKYLYIWLKRFGQNGRRFIKNSQPLDIPLEWRHDMVLSGAIIHYGSLNSGHYVYVGRNFKDGRFYLYDDSNVKLIETETELKKLLANAYWLSYEKKLI